MSASKIGDIKFHVNVHQSKIPVSTADWNVDQRASNIKRKKR
jgi:hypothetical protein